MTGFNPNWVARPALIQRLATGETGQVQARELSE